MSDESPNQNQQTLTLQTLGDIDRGRVALAFNHALRMATVDVLDRPGDKTARRVTLTVELKPVLDRETGALDEIQNEFVIRSAVPNRRSAPYPMLPTQDGKQMFHPDSPFDPRQASFAFADEQKEAKAGGADAERVDPETGEISEPEHNG